MAPGNPKLRLNFGGAGETVELVRIEAGENTGDSRYIVRNNLGRTMVLGTYFGVESIPADPPTGDQWGTMTPVD